MVLVNRLQRLTPDPLTTLELWWKAGGSTNASLGFSSSGGAPSRSRRMRNPGT